MLTTCEVTSGGTALCGWELASPPVPEELRPIVASWVGYREWSPHPVRRVEVPTGRAVLIFEFGPTMGVGVGGELRRHVGGFYAGIDDGASVTESAGLQAGVQVNLTPRGAMALAMTSMHEVARQVIGLQDVGVSSTEVDQLHEARDWSGRFDVVAAFLRRRASRARTPSAMSLWAVDRIDASGGLVRIDVLARELGFSRKHLHACFVRDVGLSPKRYAEVRRFDRMRRRLLAGPTNLADLAASLGYADQAHLARDARRFAQMTTTALQQAQRDPLTQAVHGGLTAPG